jgi:hypothetical protein
MRVLIAAPRKTGNAHLRCLLATAYSLTNADARSVPDDSDLARVDTWLNDLPEDAVAQTDYRFTPGLGALATGHDVTLVGIIRDPRDLYVSTNEGAQRRGGREDVGQHPSGGNRLNGQPLASDAALGYLSDGFADEIAWLRSWDDSGMPLVRYEELQANPASVLQELSASLAPLTPEQIAHAVDLCPPGNIVYSHPGRSRRMPEIPPGAWRERLSDAHLAIFRDRYADDVRGLGYEET